MLGQTADGNCSVLGDPEGCGKSGETEAAFGGSPGYFFAGVCFMFGTLRAESPRSFLEALWT